MDKLILKTGFIDHTTFDQYEAGADVSHLSEELKTFLVNGQHVETVTEEVKHEEPKGKKGK